MYINAISLLAVLLVALTSILLFLFEEWRASIALLAAQYAGVFVLVNLQWPMAMSVVKLVAGWMCGALLGIAISSLPETEDQSNPEDRAFVLEGETSQGRSFPVRTRPLVGRTFYLLATLLMGMVVISQAQNALTIFPVVRIEQLWGGLILIGMGLLKLGFTLEPLPAVIGMLTALSGFEILYSSIESTALVAAIFAGINLGLALAGAYLLLVSHLEESE